MSQNRLETYFGDDGLKVGGETKQGNLQAFGARYRFVGRTWGLTVWAPDWAAAEAHCREFGMEVDGKIEGRY